MKKLILGLALIASSHLAPVASATVIIDMKVVGDVGNRADTSGVGRVDYEYYIGTYEVTNAQYAEFLNAVAKSDPHGLYNTNMGGASGGITRSGSSGSYVYTVKAGAENRPVNFVSFFDGARFANWLSNGQGNGDTEAGSYNLTIEGKYPRIMGEPSATPQYFLASENEWYKAAYYDPTLNDGAGGYWKYPSMSNTDPTKSTPTSLANSANFGNVLTGPVDVGSYEGTQSYYGTFDQEGNVAEILETLFLTSSTSRIRRGSHYGNELIGALQRTSDVQTTEAGGLGIRLSAIMIPEPSSVALMGISGIAFGGWLLKRNVKTRKTTSSVGPIAKQASNDIELH